MCSGLLRLFGLRPRARENAPEENCDSEASGVNYECVGGFFATNFTN